MMARVECCNRPLAEYTIPVNELLDSGIAEVKAFAVNYIRKKIYGIATPIKTPVTSISHILGPKSPTSPNLKQERQDSLTPDLSDEETHMHARVLLNLASPEAASRTPSDTASPPQRKKQRTRYADSASQSFQMVRPAYEFMNGPSPMENIRHIRNVYSVPESPPQSPPEMDQRVRARPGKCARRGQGCNENTKFRPVITDWTCYKNYEPCPKDSQVGWCNKCWCNKGHYSEEDFLRRKFDLLEDQIMVWADEFHIDKFEVVLQNRDGMQSTSNLKNIVDPTTARRYVLGWRDEWERTGTIPSIKIRPV